MCLIIIKPKGIKFNNRIYEQMEKAAKCNNDGFGYALRKKPSIWQKHIPSIVNQDVIVTKELMDINKLIIKLKTIKVEEDDELMIHLRLATHGPVSLNNVQPIVMDEHWVSSDNGKEYYCLVNGAAFAHNGIISEYGYAKDNLSDSHAFARDFLNRPTSDNKKIREVFYKVREQLKTKERFKEEMDKYPILKANRLAMLDTKYGLLIFGGGWYKDDHGILYSNKGIIGKANLVK